MLVPADVLLPTVIQNWRYLNHMPMQNFAKIGELFQKLEVGTNIKDRLLNNKEKERKGESRGRKKKE